MPARERRKGADLEIASGDCRSDAALETAGQRHVYELRRLAGDGQSTATRLRNTTSGTLPPLDDKEYRPHCEPGHTDRHRDSDTIGDSEKSNKADHGDRNRRSEGMSLDESVNTLVERPTGHGSLSRRWRAEHRLEVPMAPVEVPAPSSPLRASWLPGSSTFVQWRDGIAGRSGSPGWPIEERRRAMLLCVVKVLRHCCQSSDGRLPPGE